MGPLHTAKMGSSHDRESKSSRRLLILLEKKSQKHCGSSERRTSDGRGALRDFPNSSLDTEKSCRLEHIRDNSVTIELSLSRQNTRPHSSSLFNKDLSVHCEAGLSPSSLGSSPPLSCRPDLLRHPRSGGTVSNTPGNRRSMAVEHLS